MKRLKRTYRFYFIVRRLIKKDKLRIFSIRLQDKIYCWRNGFLPESYVIYNLKNNKHHVYLSDIQRLTKASKINNRHTLIIDDKYVFANLFKEDKATLPLFYILNNVIQKFNTKEKISKEELLLNLKKGNHYVFKSVGGGGGEGIIFVDYIDFKWVVDHKTMSDLEFVDFLENFKDTIISPKIIQDGFCAELYPKSLNTIRILTMINPKNQKPFIAAAVLRCGSKETKGLDNWSSGGLSINVNLEDGRLSKAVAFPKNGELVWYDKHPDTGFEIEGFTIPNWEVLKRDILKIADKHFYLPYIGWDVVLFKDDFLILEANGNSDVNLLQVHKPLLEKNEVKDFYKFHNVVNG